MKYKDTLNLPQTGFPMKAGLVEREPERLNKWYTEDIYRQLRTKHAEAKETFVLHDGHPLPMVMYILARRSTKRSRISS